jgi:hypothetical protein
MGAMSAKLDAAIDALVDALAELPEHQLEGWQRGNRLGLRILCELGRRYPAVTQRGPLGRIFLLGRVSDHPRPAPRFTGLVRSLAVCVCRPDRSR